MRISIKYQNLSASQLIYFCFILSSIEKDLYPTYFFAEEVYPPRYNIYRIEYITGMDAEQFRAAAYGSVDDSRPAYAILYPS